MSQPIVFQSNTDSLAQRRRELVHLIGEAARSLRKYALTERERQVCDDAARPSSPRLSIQGLDTLSRLAARSERPFILEETFRTAVLSQIAHQAPCLDEANEAETEANHPLNQAQLFWERERTPIRALQVVETGRQQLHATRVLVDVFALRAYGKRS